METIILIMTLLTADGAAVSSVETDSVDACLRARSLWLGSIQEYDWYVRGYAICVPKGDL